MERNRLSLLEKRCYCFLKFFSALLQLFSTLESSVIVNTYLAFLGVIVCGRAAFAEICDDTNQAVGVSLVFAAWNSAIVLGPAVGGKSKCRYNIPKVDPDC